MNILSLFDGIACGRIALERANIKVDKYYASEIDKYAIQVATKNYPNIIELGNVNNWEQWDLPKIDMLIGGSPCQDLSISKKDRKGLDGERSGLFWKYVDCLKKFKPKYFLLENVASMPKEAKEVITETLGVEPILINSALLSAQQRKRLYWTNIPNVIQPQDKHILLKDILLSGTPCDVKNKGYEINKLRIDKSQSLLARDYKGFGNQTMSGVLEPICVNSQSGSRNGERKQPSVADRIYNINGKNPSLGKGGQGERIYSVKDKSVSLNANGGGRGAKTGLYKIDLPDGDYTIRKLHPVECERLQTLPDNYTKKGLIQWNYVNVMGATEPVKLKLDTALCTTNDEKDTEQQNYLYKKENNVNFVADLLLQEKCVIGTIKIGNATKTQNIQIKLDKDTTDTDIKNHKESTRSNTENLHQNISEEIYCQQKWFTILTLIKKTIQEKISLFAPKHNISRYIINCKLPQENLLEMDLSSLKMESITEISNSQRYKALGNGWTVDVITHIFRYIPQN